MEKALHQQHQVQAVQLQYMLKRLNELKLKLPFPEGNGIESTKQRLQFYCFFLRAPHVIHLIGEPINMNRVEVLKRFMPRYRKEIVDFLKWEYYRRVTRGAMVFIHPFDFINRLTTTLVVPSMGLVLVPPHTLEEIELYNTWQRRLIKNVDIMTAPFSHVSLAQLQIVPKVEGETRDYDNMKKALAQIRQRTANNEKCLRRVRAVNPRNIRPGLQPIIDPYQPKFASWEMEFPNSFPLDPDDLMTKKILKLKLKDTLLIDYVLESAVAHHQRAAKRVAQKYPSLLNDLQELRHRRVAGMKVLLPELYYERAVERAPKRNAQKDNLSARQSAVQNRTQPIS